MINEETFASLEMPVDRDKVNKALEDWAAFNETLLTFNLKELYAMYNIELMIMRRESFMNRIRQRIKVVTAEAADEFLLELRETRKPKGVRDE